ncbi:MAG: porin, partial [Bacteroidales bacterium]
MRLSKLLLSLVVCCACSLASAANDSTTLESNSRKEKAFNVKLMLRGDYRGDLYDGTTTSRFTMKPAMVDLYGEINPVLSYYFRQRFDTPFTIQDDGIPASTLVAYVQLAPVDGLIIRLGKQSIAYGSYEFDYNPMDVYFYSKVGYMTQGFSTGASVGYTLGNHSLTYQVTKTLDDIYKMPGYKSAFNNTFQWGGKFFDGAFNTLWSYTLINPDKGKFLHQY